MVALVHGGGLGAAGVGACVGLSQAEGADLLALGQGDQILFLLLLIAEGVDGPGAQRGVGGEDDACAAVHPGQLFHGDGVAQGVAPHAAVFHGEGDAHPAQLAQLFHGLGGELVVLVQHECDGFDLFFCKGADPGAELLVGLGGLKQHRVTSLKNVYT